MFFVPLCPSWLPSHQRPLRPHPHRQRPPNRNRHPPHPAAPFQLGNFTWRHHRPLHLPLRRVPISRDRPLHHRARQIRHRQFASPPAASRITPPRITPSESPSADACNAAAVPPPPDPESSPQSTPPDACATRCARVARYADFIPQHPRLLQLRLSPLIRRQRHRHYPVSPQPGSIPKISMATSVAPADRNATALPLPHLSLCDSPKNVRDFSVPIPVTRMTI